MPGRIRQADVDEVKARTNIADIIGERVALKTAGVGALKGLCPFHDERSPSFNVRPQHGYYHCFGCGESGDVYSFLRAMDHVSFTEAVERLAGKLGFALHYEDGGAAPETSGRSRLYAANAAAAEWFRERLASPEADTGRRFLGERGFDAGAAAHFGVGYAPKGWSGLSEALTAKGFSRDELLAAGLLSQGQRGVYDRFRGRLVWPIRDVTGQTLGFGARRLYDDDQGPKYLNTPETAIYKKAQVLYGLDLARKDVSREHRVTVVEGYTDVMACHLSGVTTAVATCGTAFGSAHVSVVGRVLGDAGGRAEVVFTFDPDAAGQSAALRAFAESRSLDAQTFVAAGPDGLDPCDLRLQRGEGAVREMVEHRSPLFEFVLDRRLAEFDLDTVEGRVAGLKATVPVVADIADDGVRNRYTALLARRLGEDLDGVRRAVANARRRGPSEPASRAPARPAADGPAPEAPRMPDVRLASIPRGGPLGLERGAVMGFLQYGHALDDDLLARAVTVALQHPGLDAVRAAIAAAPDRRRPGWASAVAESVREPYRVLAIELLTEPFPERDETRALASAADLARRLVVRSIETEKTGLLGAIQRVPADSDEGRRVRLRLRELDAERTRLESD